MTIAAQAIKGQEFVYRMNTAHKVSKVKAEKIIEILNAYNYKLAEGYIWHVYEVDQYDNAFIYASDQSFTLGKTGILRERYLKY